MQKIAKTALKIGIPSGIVIAVVILGIALTPVQNSTQYTPYGNKPLAKAPPAPTGVTCALQSKMGSTFLLALKWTGVNSSCTYNVYRGFTWPSPEHPWTTANRIFTGVHGNSTGDLVVITTSQTVYYTITTVSSTGIESAFSNPTQIMIG